MQEENKGKIQVTPKSNRFVQRSTPAPKEIEEFKQEIKRLKKQIGRLLNIAEHEEYILEKNRGKKITLKLIDGSKEIGLLKEITKFQMIITQTINSKEFDCYFYKSALIKYHFN